MRKGRGIQSRGLSIVEYEGLEMANEGEKIRKANRTLRRALQSQRDCL